MSFSSCAPARAASNFFRALLAASRPFEMFLKAGLRKSSIPPWASRRRFWKVRRTSANLLPHSTARPPPAGSMNILPMSAPMSRLAALIRSAAPDHCCLIASVAPPNLSIMPLVRASIAWSASIWFFEIIALTSALDLPKALPMISAALMPRWPSWMRSWPVILPAALIWAITNARSASCCDPPPEAATAFCIASSSGITFSTSTPKAISCCCAEINVALLNGEFWASLPSFSICSLTAFWLPSMVLRAAFAFCCMALYARPVLRVFLPRAATPTVAPAAAVAATCREAFALRPREWNTRSTIPP